MTTDTPKATSSMNQTLLATPDVEAPPASVDSDSEQWSALFHFIAPLEEHERHSMLSRLSVPGAFVDQAGRTTLAIAAHGPMDTALTMAMTTVLETIEEVAPNAAIDEVRMVGHRDAERQLQAHQPVSYYGVTECAKALGVTRQRVRQLLEEKRLPQPSATVGGKHIWESTAFDRFAERRNRALEKTPLGRDPLEFDDFEEWLRVN
jgi:hypothetical protein